MEFIPKTTIKGLKCPNYSFFLCFFCILSHNMALFPKRNIYKSAFFGKAIVATEHSVKKEKEV